MILEPQYLVANPLHSQLVEIVRGHSKGWFERASSISPRDLGWKKSIVFEMIRRRPSPPISTCSCSFCATRIRSTPPISRNTDFTKYTAQLATVSGVEKQVQTNDLTRIAGRVHRYEHGAALRLDRDGGAGGKAAELLRPEHHLADRTIAAGQPRRIDLRRPERQCGRQRSRGPRDEPFEWASLDNDGNPLPPGTYTLLSVRNDEC